MFECLLFKTLGIFRQPGCDCRDAPARFNTGVFGNRFVDGNKYVASQTCFGTAKLFRMILVIQLYIHIAYFGSLRGDFFQNGLDH